jgi:hypothetical protein
LAEPRLILEVEPDLLVRVLGRDRLDLLDDDPLEELLHLGDGILVLGPRPKAAGVEAMEQVVDGLEAHQDAEFRLEDPWDIEPPRRADAVLGPRRGVEALSQAGVLLRGQPQRASAARSLVEGLDASLVVLGDPVLDGPERTAQG